jgi:hypothetical protein
VVISELTSRMGRSHDRSESSRTLPIPFPMDTHSLGFAFPGKSQSVYDLFGKYGTSMGMWEVCGKRCTGIVWEVRGRMGSAWEERRIMYKICQEVFGTRLRTV